MTATPRRAVSIRVEPRPSTELTARWEIAPRALGANASAALVWSIHPDAGSARATLILDGAERVVRETDVIMVRDDAGLLHVTAPHALLVAAFDARGRTRYARTSLLAELRIPGGRYDVAGFDAADERPPRS
ncbi:MAG: hypothetical protein HBSAPP03_12610 [Phycisphaerae bacterium]|nr:MAG: hypothetical protein HBSAPP03_12610 [Phycisphaerae bacterium]